MGCVANLLERGHSEPQQTESEKGGDDEGRIGGTKTPQDEDTSGSEEETQSVDSQTLDESLEEVAPDADELHALCTELSSVDDDQDCRRTPSTAESLFYNEAYLEQTGTAEPEMTQATSAAEFIPIYSTINLVRSSQFAAQWPKFSKGKAFEDTIGRCAARRGSRDDPSPFFYHCKTPGCLFKGLLSKKMFRHELGCTKEAIGRRAANANVPRPW